MVQLYYIIFPLDLLATLHIKTGHSQLPIVQLPNVVGVKKSNSLQASSRPHTHAKQVCCSTDDGQINLTLCLFASLPARSSSKFPIPCTCHSHIPSSRRPGKNHDVAEAVNTGLLLLDIPGDVATCPLCAIIE